jgi:hypothetical protein
LFRKPVACILLHGLGNFKTADVGRKFQQTLYGLRSNSQSEQVFADAGDLCN